MSMPSSSALVATTQRMRASRRPSSMRRRVLGQVAAAIGHGRSRAAVAHLVAQVLEHDLDGCATAEHQRGHVGLHQVVREPHRPPSRSSRGCPARVHDRRVVDSTCFWPDGAPLSIHQHHVTTPVMREACSRGLPMVAEAAMKSGSAAVEARDAHEAPHHVGQVRAEHAAVGVQLVHHHVAQVGEEARPVGVVRQDAGVQHVRVGDEHAARSRAARRASPGVSPS
jgi:hypothetical protein